ncbi:dynein axonemal heavy chain 7-like [Polistes fuscatus]|uniref:dynein axonemal heavy chain 7-like n=1 Tax=Polistes fuscatus TaxID=30207 RepID=UPI001CAA3351|nr:dynein axonemal heavy chain 7-like [Polistes fuscatus]
MRRSEREQFRRYIVGLITKPELSETKEDLQIDNNTNRYYYYIYHGVDTTRIARIQEDVLKKILNLVPRKFRDKFIDYTNQLLIEIEEDFSRNIKRAVLESALLDPYGEDQRYKDETPVVRVDTQCIERYRYILEKSLHLINPCMRMTLEQWIVDYEYVIMDLLPLISNMLLDLYIYIYF